MKLLGQVLHFCILRQIKQNDLVLPAVQKTIFASISSLTGAVLSFSEKLLIMILTNSG